LERSTRAKRRALLAQKGIACVTRSAKQQPLKITT
jgi:hypothetical protein